MNSRRISIFIPCYNASETIEETLESVQDAVLHSGKRIPVYIYDDCSKDDSIIRARAAWRNQGSLTIVQNAENLGERTTCNKAFDYFSGKYDWVCMIHADDLVKPEWISVIEGTIDQADQERCFTIWSSYDGLENETRKITPGANTGETSIRTRTKEDIAFYLTKLYSSWHISGAAFNVSLYMQLDGFDRTMAQFGDTDFFVRALMAGYHDIYIAKSLTAYRIFPNSVSDISAKTNRDIREIYMLIRKFRESLTKSDQGKMYGTIQRLGFRRSVKYLLKRQFGLSIKNAAIFIRSFYKRIILNFS